MLRLIRGVFTTGSGAMVNLLLGMVSIKVMAVMLGPAGTGLWSLIRQVVNTIASLGLGGQSALVQGVASKDGAARDSYVRTTFFLYVFAAIFSVALIQLFAPEIAALVFKKSDLGTIHLVRWTALPVFLLQAYIYSKGVINGFRAIGRLAIVEMLGPLVMLSLVYPVCKFVGEGHALAFVWMLSASQMVMLAASSVVLFRMRCLSALFARSEKNIDREDFGYFFTIAGTTFVTAMMTTGALLVVRTMIVRTGGLAQAGLFDLAWSLSGSYVMLLLASFGTYYTPTLSQATGIEERALLVQRVIRLSTMLMVPMIVAVVVLKPLLVRALYTDAYIPSLDTVRWMLIGDYFKITSWVLAVPVVVNRDMKIYFWTETLWNAGFLGLSAISIIYFREIQGIGIAFTFMYFILSAYYLQYVRRAYALRITRELLAPWLVGLGVVVVASIQYWNFTSVPWISSLIWMVGSIGLVFMFLTKHEKSMVLEKLRSRTGRN
jgi:O-antigen/teichoic acid export membrane protein